MKKCMKSQRCKNMIASYLIGCLLAIVFILCTSVDNYGSNEFIFGFYLFLFCQILIWEPLSMGMILLIHKIRILPSILDNFWQCVLYAILPSLLMLADAFCGNVLIKHFNVDSIFLLVLVYLSYYIITILIAVMHRIIISDNQENHGSSKSCGSDHFS